MYVCVSVFGYRYVYFFGPFAFSFVHKYIRLFVCLLACMLKLCVLCFFRLSACLRCWFASACVYLLFTVDFVCLCVCLSEPGASLTRAAQLPLALGLEVFGLEGVQEAEPRLQQSATPGVDARRKQQQ